MIRTTLALLATLGTQSALAATVIHAGFLFDTKEGDLLEKQTITIEGGRVVSVDDGFLTPEGSSVIDLSNAYVSPGFMDMHVHLDGELDPPASTQPVNEHAAGELYVGRLAQHGPAG